MAVIAEGLASIVKVLNDASPVSEKVVPWTVALQREDPKEPVLVRAEVVKSKEWPAVHVVVPAFTRLAEDK